MLLTGHITLNTQQASNLNGAIELVASGTTPFFFGVPSNGNYAARVLRGTYTLRFDAQNSCNNGSDNTRIPCTGERLTACQ